MIVRAYAIESAAVIHIGQYYNNSSSVTSGKQQGRQSDKAVGENGAMDTGLGRYRCPNGHLGCPARMGRVSCGGA